MKTHLIAFSLLNLIWCSSAFAAPSGKVVGWGENTTGQVIGMPSLYPLNNRTGLVLIAGQVLSNVVAISIQDGLGLALGSDGTIFGWGDDYGGRVLNKNGFLTERGSFNPSLKRDGTVVAWGNYKVPEGLSNMVAVTTHEGKALAVRKDGSVVSWSDASWNPKRGQLMKLTELSNVVAVAVGGEGNVAWNTALKSDGTIVVWQHDVSVQETVPKEATSVVAIAVGTSHTLALRRDGTVIGFGFNGGGQVTGIPSNQAPGDPSFSAGQVTLKGQVLSNVVAVAAAQQYSMALKRDGTVVGWGLGYPSTPAGLSNVTAIAAGNGFCLALTTNTSFLETTK